MSAATPGSILAALLEGATGAQVSLTLEDAAGAQFVVLLEHASRPELVLGLADRSEDVAAVTLERGGVQLLRDALTKWLNQ